MAARKTYILKLYVAGNTPNSVRALNTLKEILENEFKGVYALKVIDVLKQPQLAEEDKILAIGIGHDVSRYYSKAVTIMDVDQLGEVLLKELSDIFSVK